MNSQSDTKENPASIRIGLLEDEPHLGELVKLWLEGEGYGCEVYASGRDMIDTLKSKAFDLLILDWMVPDIDGEGVLTWVRENLEWHIPVIFVTQRDEKDDIVKILNLGADDYVTKPVDQNILMARVTALARRANLLTDTSPIHDYGAYRVDGSARTVSHHGETVKLTQKEFDLVNFLFKNVGRIISRNHILESVWGHKSGINTRTADTHISRIRNKLNLVPENGWRISAIYHHGYRLERLEGDRKAG